MSQIENLKNQAKELLKIHYNYDTFRPGQEEAIDNILADKNTVVIMPTGGGKSLIYQLPALVLEGVAIVISPLISLMKDQVDSLNRIGIPATFVNSSISLSEAFDRLVKIKQGHFKLLYIAPERFYNEEFLNALKEIKVSLFAIDEAHCISQWGHDFRPSYLKLKYAINLTNNPPVVTLTATATPEVKNDIVKQLDLKEPKIIVTGFGRPNLQFVVKHAKERDKTNIIAGAVISSSDDSGIIYTSTRAKAEEVAEHLVSQGVDAVVYHAGLDPESRQWVQNNFMNGKAQVVVATNAFGLGIDKKNIRFVIHHDMPGNVEAYYQEAGRAGRDGKKSVCLLLYNSRDRHLQEFFIKGDNPPPSIVVELYENLLRYETDSILVTYSELSKTVSDDVPDMAIGTALKILEREGFISRPNEKTANAFLKITSDYKTIYDKYLRAKKQTEVIQKLRDRYENELAQGWNFNAEEISSIIDVKKESLTRSVKKMAGDGLAIYQPPFRGTEIKILKRVEPSEIDIDFSAMKEKMKRAYEKLNQIEDYVFTTDCRQKYILDYFKDINAKDCKHCDNCLNENQSFIYRETDRHAGASKDNEIKEVKLTKSLNTKLTQLETLELFNKGYSIKDIAEARDLTEGTITNHLCFLIEKKILKSNAVDKIVDKSKQRKIKKASAKIGREKLKPLKDELGDDISYDEIKIVLNSGD